MEYDYSLEDPRFTAAIDMIRRTGSQAFSIRYQDDEEPIVWMAVAKYEVNDRGKPVNKSARITYKVGADLHPVGAVFKLLDEIIDGGQCTYCKRATGVSVEIERMPMDLLICWYQYDPELKTFRRGCE